MTDFGLSGLHTGGDGDGGDEEQVFKTTLGSPNYVALEVLIDKGYNGFKAEMWNIQCRDYSFCIVESGRLISI